MSPDGLHDLEFDDSRFSSVVWEMLGRERQAGGVVYRLSCVIDKLPALLILECCDMRIPATASLVRLRMEHARLSGVNSVIQLDDVSTSIGTLVRRVFLLSPQYRRAVIAAAAEVDGRPDAVVQFVIPGIGQDVEYLESLSLLSISKVLEMYELDEISLTQ